MDSRPLTILVLTILGKLIVQPSRTKSIMFLFKHTVVDVACQGRIIGGFPMGEAPYQVSLQNISGNVRCNKNVRCGSTILTPDVVITAAHCTNITGSGVRVGSTKWSSGGQWRVITTIRNHKKYVDEESGYDFILLFLEPSLELNENVQPIDLNEQKIFEAGTIALVTGWGIYSSKIIRSPTLKGVELQIIDFEICAKRFESYVKISEDVVCAGFPEFGNDACQGDSGGSLVIENKLVGIVGYGVDGSLQNYPGVYTNVANHLDRIAANIILD